MTVLHDDAGQLSKGASVVQKAAEALQGRRTRSEVQGHKRKTTKDVYRDAWANFSAYMEYRRSRSKKDLKNWVLRSYTSKGESYWLERLEASLSEVDHRDVQSYKLAMLNQPGPRGAGLAKSTITVRLAALAHLFKIALREGAVTYNPASPDYVDREKALGRRQKHVLSLEEVKKVLSHHNSVDAVTTRNRTLFLLLAWTGIRRQEASELYLGDLEREPEGLMMTLRRKGDKEEVVLLPAGLEAELGSYLDRFILAGPVFPSMKRLPDGALKIMHWAITPDTITAIVRQMTREALGTAYGPHRLRHFFANEAWDKGGSIEMIQQYLGHESANTTKVYLELKPRRDRSAAELIDLD